MKICPLAIQKLKDINCHELFALDTLHCIWIEVFSHLMGCVMGFLKTRSRLYLFNGACLACIKYLNFSKPKTMFSVVKTWTGFENFKSGRNFLPYLCVALTNPEPSQVYNLRRVLKFVRNFLHFSLFYYLRTCTDCTIGYMRRHLEDLDEANNIFVEF